LATAHAKARLSNKVESRDAEVAIDLVRFACFKKVLEREKKSSGKRKEAADSSEEEEMEDEVVTNEGGTTRTKKLNREKNKRPLNESDEDEEEMEAQSANQEENGAGDIEMNNEKQPRKRTRKHTTQSSQSQASESTGSSNSNKSTLQIVTAEKLKEFKSLLFKLFHRERSQALGMQAILEYVTGESNNLTESEIRSALSMMQDDNQIMLSDENVFLI
jgi:DNA replication licensing factor MCM3